MYPSSDRFKSLRENLQEHPIFHGKKNMVSRRFSQRDPLNPGCRRGAREGKRRAETEQNCKVSGGDSGGTIFDVQYITNEIYVIYRWL